MHPNIPSAKPLTDILTHRSKTWGSFIGSTIHFATELIGSSFRIENNPQVRSFVPKVVHFLFVDRAQCDLMLILDVDSRYRYRPKKVVLVVVGCHGKLKIDVMDGLPKCLR